MVIELVEIYNSILLPRELFKLFKVMPQPLLVLIYMVILLLLLFLMVKLLLLKLLDFMSLKLVLKRNLLALQNLTKIWEASEKAAGEEIYALRDELQNTDEIRTLTSSPIRVGVMKRKTAQEMKSLHNQIK